MSKKRDKKPINVKIGDRVLECQLKGHKSDEFMASLCGLEYPSSYKRCLRVCQVKCVSSILPLVS